jgi:hypothetical protein
LDLKIIWNSAFVIIIENEEYRKIVEDTEEHISEYANQGLRTLCMAKRVIQIILSKYIYSLPPIFVVSAKCIDPWALEFVVSNTTGNNLWENCISLDFNFRSFS